MARSSAESMAAGMAGVGGRGGLRGRVHTRRVVSEGPSGRLQHPRGGAWARGFLWPQDPLGSVAQVTCIIDGGHSAQSSTEALRSGRREGSFSSRPGGDDAAVRRLGGRAEDGAPRPLRPGHVSALRCCSPPASRQPAPEDPCRCSRLLNLTQSSAFYAHTTHAATSFQNFRIARGVSP